MKALVYMGPEVLSFQDMPDPQPERGEVLIKVAGVGICGSDMHAFLGHSFWGMKWLVRSPKGPRQGAASR